MERLSMLLVALALLMLVPDAALAQRKNAAYFELLGNGGLYSLNYERAVLGGFGGRLGASRFPGFLDEPKALWLPLMAVYVAGEGRHRFELGFGPLLRIGDRERTWAMREPFYTATLAYRYESPKGLLFRAGLTPLYTFPVGNKEVAGWMLSAGVGIGYAF